MKAQWAPHQFRFLWDSQIHLMNKNCYKRNERRKRMVEGGGDVREWMGWGWKKDKKTRSGMRNIFTGEITGLGKEKWFARNLQRLRLRFNETYFKAFPVSKSLFKFLWKLLTSSFPRFIAASADTSKSYGKFDFWMFRRERFGNKTRKML